MHRKAEVPRSKTSAKRARSRGVARGSRAYLTVFSFPDTVEGVLFLNEGDFLGGRTLLDTVLDGATEWTAPRWADKGDVAFFYYSRRALKNVRRVRRQFALVGALTSDVEHYLARAEQDAEDFGGCIVSYEFATGRAFRRGNEPDGEAHWRTPHYVRCSGGETFTVPLDLLQCRGELPVPHGGTILSLHPNQFRRLVERLQEAGNRLGKRLLRVVPTTQDGLDAHSESWRAAACAPQARFMNEGELRGAVIDHLLDEIKDPRTVVYQEVECHSRSGAAGRADYVISLGKLLVAVEAKLNVLTERDLLRQVRKYIDCSKVVASRGGRSVELRRSVRGYCIVFDQAGIYVLGATGYVGCTARRPLIERPHFANLSGAAIREVLLRAMR